MEKVLFLLTKAVSFFRRETHRPIKKTMVL
jgi:hypothetical protein